MNECGLNSVPLASCRVGKCPRYCLFLFCIILTFSNTMIVCFIGACFVNLIILFFIFDVYNLLLFFIVLIFSF